jgi:hypothetical protein
MLLPVAFQFRNVQRFAQYARNSLAAFFTYNFFRAASQITFFVQIASSHRHREMS